MFNKSKEKFDVFFLLVLVVVKLVNSTQHQPMSLHRRKKRTQVALETPMNVFCLRLAGDKSFSHSTCFCKFAHTEPRRMMSCWHYTYMQNGHTHSNTLCKLWLHCVIYATSPNRDKSIRQHKHRPVGNYPYKIPPVHYNKRSPQQQQKE